MKNAFVLLAGVLVVGWSTALFAGSVTPVEDIPAYYANIDGTSGLSLFSNLTIITNKGFKTLGYDGLYTAYLQSDCTESGAIWDMYSNCTFSTSNKCGDYSRECDCYNREHSIPKSWFGDKKTGIGCDIFHVVPTDGWVNGKRSNYPFGEVKSATYTSKNGSQLGTSVSSIKVGEKTICSTAGSSVSAPGTVFEPIDEYKGDFARGYLGTLMKWNPSEKMTDKEGSKMFQSSYTKNTNWGLTTYGVALLLKWHREDPVSQKEIDRNNGIQMTQGNRNPFIDYPFLAEYIWGKMAGETVCLACLIPSTDPDFKVGKDDGWRGKPEGMEEVTDDRLQVAGCKVMRNGQIILVVDGVEYNILGVKIK